MTIPNSLFAKNDTVQSKMKMTSDEIKYCQRCGHGLTPKWIEQKSRPYCDHCGHIVFLDPKLAAVILVSKEGKLVLVRRAVEPALGRWSFPSGYVDRGEAVEDAAIREVKEETGLDVRLRRFVGLYSSTANPVVLAVYAADVTGGSMRAGHDTQSVALYSADGLPIMPFPHDDQILADWRKIPQD